MMNHSALTTIFLTSIILATSQALLLGMVKDLPRKKCMPLDLKACSQLGYNKTHYHPHLYLSSRRTELFEYFGLLRLTRCSKDLLFYMCMVYQPICFHDYDEPIPPCKSVCEGVRSGCLDIITRYGFKWPEELNCKNLPDHQSGVCIKPSAIIKNRVHLQDNPLVENQVEAAKQTNCPQCTKQVGLKRFKYFKRADFAIQAIFKKRSTGPDGKTKLTFEILSVYKRGHVSIPASGDTDLWSATPCLCPKLQLDMTYMILGRENTETNQLLFNAKIIIEASSTYFQKKMLKYSKKYENVLKRRRQKKLRWLLKNKGENRRA